jgi:hypothetical protein
MLCSLLEICFESDYIESIINAHPFVKTNRKIIGYSMKILGIIGCIFFFIVYIFMVVNLKNWNKISRKI